jgi:putative membrane protein
MSQKKRIKETIILLLKGGAIGVANIIPGVSGGTLAVVLGVYDKLIEAISLFFESPDKQKEYSLFLVKVFIGAGLSIVLLSNVMDFLLNQQFSLTMFTFMGLILGGVPSIWKAQDDMNVSLMRVVSFAFGAVVVLFPIFLGAGAEETGSLKIEGATVLSVHDYIMLILAGFLAGGGMIIPGISGSFILVIMGQYSTIIAAIKNFAFVPLFFVAVGAMSGIFIFSKIIKVCLDKAPSVTFYFIMGLVIASACALFPGFPGSSGAVLFSVFAFVVGLATAYLMSKVAE